MADETKDIDDFANDTSLRPKRPTKAELRDAVRFMTRNEPDPAFRKRVETVFEWLPLRDDSVLLDCGCGRGFYLKMLRFVGRCHIAGIELDGTTVSIARENTIGLSDILIAQADVCSLPFSDCSFDGVIMSEILEHLDDDLTALREAYRVLKPNGICVVTVPNSNYPLAWDPINWLLERLFGLHVSKGPLAGIWAGHVRLYSRERLLAVVENAGFSVEEERTFTHYCFPFVHNLIYGLGKPLLDSGLLPKRLSSVADRAGFETESSHWWNPLAWLIGIIRLFDRPNDHSEPPGRSTVNIAVKARKQG